MPHPKHTSIFTHLHSSSPTEISHQVFKMCTYTYLYFLCFHTSAEPRINLCLQAMNGEQCLSLPTNEYFQTFVYCPCCHEGAALATAKRQEEQEKVWKQKKEAEEFRESHWDMLPHLEAQSQFVTGGQSTLRKLYNLIRLTYNIGVYVVKGEDRG